MISRSLGVKNKSKTQTRSVHLFLPPITQKPKSIDEKVCVEGLFTIVLRCIEENGKHLFVTQSADGAISKSPMGMFSDLTIDNDLLIVEKAIREYYGLPDTVASTDRKEEEKK